MPTRVLLVEDDPDTRELVTELLETEFHIAAHEDAEAALEALEAGPFDVVLTDETLPGKTGRQLAQEIRERWPGTRVYVVSGHELPPDGPYDGVLPKPFDIQRLLRILRQPSHEDLPASDGAPQTY